MAIDPILFNENTPIASPMINSLNFWDGNTDSYGKESVRRYLLGATTYPSAVERAKTLLANLSQRGVRYQLYCVNSRGQVFFQSPLLDLSSYKVFRWKILTPDYSRFKAMYLSIVAVSGGRRSEGRVRLQFHLASILRPCVIVDGEDPSWTAKRINLLGRVLWSLKNQGFTSVQP